MPSIDTHMWMRGILLFLLGMLTVFLVSNAIRSGAPCAQTGVTGSVCGTCAFQSFCEPVSPLPNLPHQGGGIETPLTGWEGPGEGELIVTTYSRRHLASRIEAEVPLREGDNNHE